MIVENVLIIGFPFMGRLGGDSARATLEHRAIGKKHNIEHLLLISAREDIASVISAHGDDEVHVLKCRPNRGLSPAIVCTFDKKEINKFHDLLRDRAYTLILFRYLGGTGLVSDVERILPHSQIVIDADMLASRIAQQAWKQARTFGNRYLLFESWKLRRYERGLFNRPYVFLMSNYEEIDWVRKHYLPPRCNARFALVPNAMPAVSPTATRKSGSATTKYILFHGVLQSLVNLDAFRFLVEEIYPHLHHALNRHDIRIHVVGKGLSTVHRDLVLRHGCTHITLVGEVEDIGQVVSDSLFCLVPLRLGSGTKTRILEAAAYGKAVVTTPVGAEGLGLNENEIVVRDGPVAIAQAVIYYMVNREALSELGANMQRSCLNRYSEHSTSIQLLEAIDGSNVTTQYIKGREGNLSNSNGSVDCDVSTAAEIYKAKNR